MAKGIKTGGRKKGSTNKLTSCIKDMIVNALNSVGGQQYLEQQAEKNPTAFLTLIGKVIPLTIAGDEDNPIRIQTESDEDVIARYNKKEK